jgi:diguanylate cyclase (GGDEF)-like protein/putative nucleotidyltransferase with HDIG domain
LAADTERMGRSLRFLVPVFKRDGPPDADGRRLAVTAPSVQSSVLAMAWMYLGGASFGLGAILIAQPKHFNGEGIVVLAIVSYALGLVLLVGRARLPAVSIELALAVGVVIVTIAIHCLGDNTEQYFSILYVWSALNSAFLLTRRRAALQVALIAASFGAYLGWAHEALHPAVQLWLLTVGTATLAAFLVGMLKARVERLVDEVAETAKRDPRTGLLNGSGFEELLDRELERALRTSGKLSVIALDLDRFKHVNDELGHRVADERLSVVACILGRTRRRIDAAARMSGQEFALLLPDTDEHGAYIMADRVRRAVRDHFADDALPATVSLGVASFPKHGSSSEELLGAVNQAVFAAKELGRDRSVIYNPEITANLRSAKVRDGMQSEDQLAAVLVLAEALDMRDDRTARHSETVGRYAKLIAAELGMCPRAVERVHLAGMLHDIGKIGISDTILQKPGKLTEPEWDEIRKHPELGARILDGARLEDISAWVRAHHERPDGSGYPHALSDEQIPIEAKILAVADSYEAMTSHRVYQPGIGRDAAREELLRCAGTQFDANVVLAFLNVLSREAEAKPAEEALAPGRA